MNWLEDNRFINRRAYNIWFGHKFVYMWLHYIVYTSEVKWGRLMRAIF